MADPQLGGPRFLLGPKDKQTWWGIRCEPWALLGPAGSLIECDVPATKGVPQKSSFLLPPLLFTPRLTSPRSQPPGPMNRRRRKTRSRNHGSRGWEEGGRGSICRERDPGQRTASGWRRSGRLDLDVGGRGSPSSWGRAQMASQCCSCGKTGPQCLSGAGGDGGAAPGKQEPLLPSRTPRTCRPIPSWPPTPRKGEGAVPKSHSVSAAGSSPGPSPAPGRHVSEGEKVGLRSPYH